MITDLQGLHVLAGTVSTVDGVQYAAVQTDQGAALAVLGQPEHLRELEGTVTDWQSAQLLVGPPSMRNVAALRRALSWLRPRRLGLRTSVGFGDRLGLATPGHIAAMRAHGAGLSPIFAQQSIREMDRTRRSPQEVVDAATWAIFCSGWREPFGADADHLKTEEDVRRCLPIGYTWWTIDPGDHVDGAADTASPAELKTRLMALPWESLDDTPEALVPRYRDTRIAVEGTQIGIDEAGLVRAAVKYGRAIAHTRRLVSLIRSELGSAGWELEVAVDETAPVTSHLEHAYFVLELQRLGIAITSFAPRFPGEFEKGIDYVGDIDAFERHLALDAAIARQLGPYKLSVHSGSDKFSVFDSVARVTRGLVHLKTAGTSYVEGLRNVASLDPTLFREVYAFAREQFELARRGYHISARLERTPPPEAVRDTDLPELLDQPDARQVLHVTYGQVLTACDARGELRFRPRLLAVLGRAPEPYSSRLQQHFARHLAPFASNSAPRDR